MLITPTPRPFIPIPSVEISTSEEISTVVTFLNEEYSHLIEFSSSQIASVEQTNTVFGTEYHMVVETSSGNTTFTVLKPVDDQPIRVSTFEPSTKPLIFVKPAITTTETVDKLTGQQIVKTNDTVLIKRNPFISAVTQTLFASESISLDSEVTSAVTKTSEKSVFATIVVKSEA